jgi:hypothetical protein
LRNKSNLLKKLLSFREEFFFVFALFAAKNGILRVVFEVFSCVFLAKKSDLENNF